jgi:hypothetical protein
MKIIEDLVESERGLLTNEQFTGTQFAGFSASWGAVYRYHTFLTMVSRREAAATRTMSKAMKAVVKAANSTQMEPDEQRRVISKLNKTTDVVHLEIESFYLFAKILLDTVARAIEKYFGQGQACSLDSHHDLIRSFEKYATLKKLVVPTDFIEKAKRLRKDVSDFRDQEIAHCKRLNRVTGTMLSADGRQAMLISTSTIVPPARMKPQASSIHVGKLMTAIEDYVACAITIIKTNRDKRSLTFTN